MTPFLSIIVISYNIPRELPRTLFSLSPKFQRNITADEYEIIIVDNGSEKVPDISAITNSGVDCELITVTNPSISPARAINIGINASIGKYVGVFIDGARIASSGLIAATRNALQLSERVVVASRGRYLGLKVQRENMMEGYNQVVEDMMLKDIDWQNNGDRLFDISVFDESSGNYWLDPIAESNSIFMSRLLWQELGGYSEQFKSPGGGFVNPDTWRRACKLPNIRPVILIGEATFHQFHNGVATNVSKERVIAYREEYEKIRGEKFSTCNSLWFYGHFDSKFVQSMQSIKNDCPQLISSSFQDILQHHSVEQKQLYTEIIEKEHQNLEYLHEIQELTLKLELHKSAYLQIEHSWAFRIGRLFTLPLSRLIQITKNLGQSKKS